MEMTTGIMVAIAIWSTIHAVILIAIFPLNKN